MDIRKTHSEAMIIARAAHRQYLEDKDGAAYDIAMKEAMKLEIDAAKTLKDRFDCEPTRGVLYRSAATMAHWADESEKAIELAEEGLKGNISNEIREELQDIIDLVKYGA